MGKETSNIKNECKHRGSHPMRFGRLISAATLITNTLLTRLGRQKPALLSGYKNTNMGCKRWNAPHPQLRIARG
jgi:hypothetical protein